MAAMKIAVVGLGVAGRSACLSLARRGHKVSGYEMHSEEKPEGSSRGTSRIFRAIPGEGAVYVDLAGRARERWLELETLGGVPLLDVTGGLMLGPQDSEFVSNCITLAEKHGSEYEIFDAARLSDRWQGLAIPGDWLACHMPQSGVLAADAACNALLRAAREAGARCKFGVRIGSHGAPGLGDLLAAHDKVVVAAGPWAPRLLPGLADTLETFRVSYAEYALPCPPPPLICSDDEFGTYGLPAGNGRYKIGMDAVGKENADPDHAWLADEKERLAEAFGNFFPDMSPDLKFHEGCFYTRTADLNFLMEETALPGGETSPDLLAMSCCSGHGFKYGPALGEIVADWAEGRSNDYLDAFSLAADRAAPAAAVGEEDG